MSLVAPSEARSKTASPAQVPKVRTRVSSDEIARVPPTGPVVFCIWAVDSVDRSSLAALALLKQLRPDLRLWRARRHDGFGEFESVARVEAARRWLESGGALGYVMEGTARTYFPAIAALQQGTGASLLAVTLEQDVRDAGKRRSRLGSVRPLRISSRVRLHSSHTDRKPRRFRELVRWHAHALRSRVDGARPAAVAEPLVPPTDPDALRGERERLQDREVLLRQGRFTVAAARAERIPAILREIGRAREETFRAVGEGTLRSIDLDEYDQHYVHLFVWDDEASRLAGAYRLGKTDELVVAGGSVRRLYTASLFDFSPGFFDRLGPALELGRSFVALEYQRSRALLLLWKGIGQLVARERRYRTLFGPVSVSAEYAPFSRCLMAQVLEADSHRHPLARLVRPRCPVERRTFLEASLGDPGSVLSHPAELSSVISSAELDGKGLPTLLNEYLRLGGRFLGFNVDAQFGGVMDGLVVVDLPETNPKLLEFYLGRDIARGLLSDWQRGGSAR